MKILNVAYPLLPVGPGSAGGAEQILYLLDRGLVKQHVETFAVAAEGSQISGTFFRTPAASADVTDAERSDAQKIHLRTIEKLLTRNHIDTIHFHGLDFGSYLPNTNIPMVATIHLPVSWYEAGSLDRPNVHLVAVSEAQAKSAGNIRNYTVIRNGVDTSKHVPGDGERSSFLWLGRICPEKGTHLALQVAREADVPLIVAGPVHPFAYHRDYFRHDVEPLLDRKRIYVGPVGLEQKANLLKRARALLIPSLAAETSSLVAMEAASSGTPVIAFSSGALPEVVRHENTGLIARDLSGMIDSIKRIDDISPTRCREYALENFSAERMVNDYISLYRDLLGA